MAARPAGRTVSEEATARLGLIPGVFGSAPATAGLVEALWPFAQTAYLDNPLPSLFKERLFVQLSRLSAVRYCIVRHAGFLIGQGYAAGDSAALPETIDNVLLLLRRPLPDAAAFEAACARLEALAAPLAIPAPRTQQEGDLLDVLTALFAAPHRSQRGVAALHHAFGEEAFERLAALLSFIRSVHLWAELHPDLASEPDAEALLGGRGELAELLLDSSEAGQAIAGEATDGMYRALFESLDAGLLVVEVLFDRDHRPRDLRVLEANAACSRLTGLHDLAGRTASQLVPDLHPYWLETFGRIARGGIAQHLEHVARADDGEGARVFEVHAIRAGAPGDRQVAVLLRDVSERKRIEEHRRLLVNELNHRVRNMLASVQSIATQTLAGALSDAETLWNFEGRLLALAKAHDLLFGASWRGVQLHDVLASELGAFSTDGRKRVVIRGPDAELRPKTALALGMAFHELASNAVKYGALSRPDGKVEVASTLSRKAPRHLRLAWSESGGPPVGKPERRGFGSRLIGAGLAYELGGAVQLKYEPGGVVCTMDIPLSPTESEHDGIA